MKRVRVKFGLVQNQDLGTVLDDFADVIDAERSGPLRSRLPQIGKQRGPQVGQSAKKPSLDDYDAR